MKYYNVLISKEAGVYVAEETIEAKSSKEAEVMAMDMAENDQVKWEYTEEGTYDMESLLDETTISKIGRTYYVDVQ